MQRSFQQDAEQREFDELCFYTLAHGSPAFIHQHVVDAFAAQHADANTKPIKIVFALVGLYLHLEKGYTGREVQRMHMRLAQHGKQWPKLPLPDGRGSITAADVLAAGPGEARDGAIEHWCASVWEAWSHARPQVIALLQREIPERTWD